MTKSEVMVLLKANRNDRGVKNWEKLGPDTGGLRSFGIGLTQLRKLARKVGRNHNLALQLWKSANHDAKIIELLIDEPIKLTREQVEDLTHRAATRARYIAMSLDETLSSIARRQAQFTLYSRKLKQKLNITDEPSWPPLRLSYTTDEVRALCASTGALDSELVGDRADVEEEWSG